MHLASPKMVGMTVSAEGTVLNYFSSENVSGNILWIAFYFLGHNDEPRIRVSSNIHEEIILFSTILVEGFLKQFSGVSSLDQSTSQGLLARIFLQFKVSMVR